jgi:protoporphyrinogen oxidase
MIHMEKQKVCIIGAGIGGLTAGALLVKQGYAVDIYEKERMVGGRAQSLAMSDQTLQSYIETLRRFNTGVVFSDPPLPEVFQQNLFKGYTLDLGFHLIGGGIVAKLREIIPESFDHIALSSSRLFEQKNSHFEYFVTTRDKISMLPNILRLLSSGEKTMKALDSVPMSETIVKYGKGKMRDVLELNPRLITTINDLALISTGEVFRTQKDMRLAGVFYPQHGLVTVCESLASFIKSNGGAIHLGTPVEKIHIEDRQAKSVEAGGSLHEYDLVVSNILVQNLFFLADESQFPSEYVTMMKTLAGTGSLCAYYALKRIDPALLGKTFVFVERGLGCEGNDAAGMIDFMTAEPQAGLSAPGHFLVQAYIICAPKEATDKRMLQRLREALDKNLGRIIPEYQKELQWAIYPATWHLDGVAKTIRNTKPEIQTPVKNLYLIGDCVKATGIGINCAINSARDLSDILSKKQ